MAGNIIKEMMDFFSFKRRKGWVDLTGHFKKIKGCLGIREDDGLIYFEEDHKARL